MAPAAKASTQNTTSDATTATAASSESEDQSELVDSRVNVVPKLEDLKASMETANETSTADAADQATTTENEEDDVCWDDLDL